MNLTSNAPRPRLERMVVVTTDGRRFDLGRPGSALFPLRRALYIRKRRKELRHG